MDIFSYLQNLWGGQGGARAGMSGMAQQQGPLAGGLDPMGGMAAAQPQAQGLDPQVLQMLMQMQGGGGQQPPQMAPQAPMQVTGNPMAGQQQPPQNPMGGMAQPAAMRRGLSGGMR